MGWERCCFRYFLKSEDHHGGDMGELHRQGGNWKVAVNERLKWDIPQGRVRRRAGRFGIMPRADFQTMVNNAGSAFRS